MSACDVGHLCWLGIAFAWLRLWVVVVVVMCRGWGGGGCKATRRTKLACCFANGIMSDWMVRRVSPKIVLPGVVGQQQGLRCYVVPCPPKVWCCITPDDLLLDTSKHGHTGGTCIFCFC